MKFLGVLVFFVSISLNLFAQKDQKLVREGNSSYNKKDYKEAEIQYRKSLDANPNQTKAKFNLGDALYMQGNFAEAQKLFKSLSNSKNNGIKSNSNYNLGNSYLSQQEYEKSIDAYKKALKASPDNAEARYNLLYAMSKLQQQQNQDQQNQDQQNQDQQNQDQQNQDQQNQDQQNQDQQNQDQQNQDQNQQKQNQQKQQLSKEEVQKILQALENNEKKTLEKLKQQKAQQAEAKKVEKDW